MILGLRTRVYTPSELCNFTEGVMYENYATLFITPLHFPTGAGGPFHIPLTFLFLASYSIVEGWVWG